MTYTFTRGDKSMSLHGYDIDQAMTIADLMIKQTVTDTGNVILSTLIYMNGRRS